jgi:hypothetical protein
MSSINQRTKQKTRRSQHNRIGCVTVMLIKAGNWRGYTLTVGKNYYNSFFAVIQ